MYQAVQYHSRSEALSAFRRMVERKKERVEEAQRELEQITKYRKQSVQAQ